MINMIPFCGIILHKIKNLPNYLCKFPLFQHFLGWGASQGSQPYLPWECLQCHHRFAPETKFKKIIAQKILSSKNVIVQNFIVQNFAAVRPNEFTALPTYIDDLLPLKFWLHTGAGKASYNHCIIHFHKL